MLSKRITSGRRRGAVGSKPTKVTKAFMARVPVDSPRARLQVLDFGAGKYQLQTRYLWKEGYFVDSYDLPENSEQHVGWVPSGKYANIIASNVLNVQETFGELRTTLRQISEKLSPQGLVTVNYPESPRYLALDMEDMRWVLERHFRIVSYTDEVFTLAHKG